MKKTPIAILISGSGSNLQALIEACADPLFPATITIVISNKPEAYGLKRAEVAGIKTRIIEHAHYAGREAFDAALHEALLAEKIEFVCLAGFMRLLSAGFTEQWRGKMINIHPSLLPLFKGTNTHAQALAAGVKIHGCSLHHVIPEMDAGEIIMQAAVAVMENDTPETLGNRVLSVEHLIYPLALRKMLAPETMSPFPETQLISC